MIIMYHANRIDFARNRVRINVCRGVTGWGVNDAFLARVNRMVHPASAYGMVHTAAVNRMVHPAGVLYGT